MTAIRRTALQALSTRLVGVSPGFARTPVAAHRSAALLQHRRQAPRPASVSAQWLSTSSSTLKAYNFQQVKEFAASPSTDRVIIDVREPSELEAGYIPTAINVPVKSQPDALFLPEEEFEDRFGFSKPAKDVEVIFYCRSGVRSSAAAKLAQQTGYQRVAEYPGSWLDWEKNGGTQQ